MAFTSPTPPNPSRTLGAPRELKRLDGVLTAQVEKLAAQVRLGIAVAALQDIAAGKPRMRERAQQALAQLEHAQANGDAS